MHSASAGSSRPRTSPRSATSPPSTSPLSSPQLSPTVSTLSVSPLTGVAQRLQPLKSQIPSVPRRLLVPASVPRCQSPDSAAAHPTKGKISNGKLTRARADSSPEISQPAKHEQRWFNFDCRFEVVEEELELVGYQIHAVEKWIVERARSTVLLTVSTGDPKDKIAVTALAPESSLLGAEAHQEWDKVIHELRRDGARPRETDKGVIMITSLANFRSDYTLVYIPGGNFLAHREQLYVNINLLRMGCSGRSALTLQESSDTTKERFINMYQFRDSIRPQEQFKSTVLALVKLVQCALSLFELFPIEAQEQNGLLCDKTVEGIQKWVAETGEEYMKIEPMERVADPSTVCALLSLVISMRGKLSALGYQTVPKDPFFYPRRFTRTLAIFVNQRLAHTPSNGPSALPTFCNHAYLNLTLIKRIDLAFDKYKSSEAYKLHRVVLNKLDDLTSATTSAIASSKGMTHGHTLSLSSKDRDGEGLLESTSDLPSFVAKVSLLRGKDGATSIRYLWTSRLDQLERKRLESVWSDAEEERERERERSDSDEDGEFLGVLPWSNRVQKKLESWAGREFGRTRTKKGSVDLSADKSPVRTHDNSTTNIPLPSVIVSRDPDEPLSGLSSGQASPTSPSASLIALGGFSSAHASALNIDDAGYFRRLQQFNLMRPALLDTRRLGTASWSDPVSAEDLIDGLDVETARAAGFPALGITPPTPQGGSRLGVRRGSNAGEESDRRKGKQSIRQRLKRSYSFDDGDFMRFEDCLSSQRMQIDVDLCAQCVIMHRRRFHVRAVIAALQALIQATSASNEVLQKYHEDHLELIQELGGKSQIAADIEEAVSQADSATAETDALLYEVRFLDISTLWRMAQGPRRRVFTIRDRVFGAKGRRYAPASHGQFNRVQRRLDGQERMVDFLGRTESEVDEESELPEIIPNDGDESSEDGGDERSRSRERDSEEGQLKALSNWLLSLFTKWGRVLGVGGAHVPDAPHSEVQKEKEKELVAEVTNSLQADISESRLRRRYQNGNGHHRLSTVGEEDETEDYFEDATSRQSTLSPDHSPIMQRTHTL